MDKYEYRVVPAPTRALRWRGIRGAKGRFAHTIETVINDVSAEGWEYLRADALPMEKRRLLSGTETILQNVLVFRRMKDAIATTQQVVERQADDDAPVQEQPLAARVPDADLVTPVDTFDVTEPVAPANSPDRPEDNDAFRKAIASIALSGARERAPEAVAAVDDTATQDAVSEGEPVKPVAPLAEPLVMTETATEVAEPPVEAALDPTPVPTPVAAEPVTPGRSKPQRVNPALAARAARLTANRTAAE